MMDALMYGMIPIANRVNFLNAPPENVSIKLQISLPNMVERAAASIPGIGICAPIRNTRSIRNVKIIFFLRSGIFQALTKVEIKLLHLYFTASFRNFCSCRFCASNFYCQSFCDISVCQHFNAVFSVFDESCFNQSFVGYYSTVFKYI